MAEVIGLHPVVKARLYDNVWVCKRCKRKIRYGKKTGRPICRYCKRKDLRKKHAMARK